MKKPIYMIVACGENRAIGKGGQLPWNIPEDAKYYIDMTEGGIVVHGRRVYEENGYAMPNRETIVLTRNTDLTYADARTAPSLEEGIALAQHSDHPGPIWIAGGAGVYKQGLEIADKLYLTLIHASFEGDTFFPEWDPPFNKILSERQSANGEFTYTFFELGRS